MKNPVKKFQPFEAGEFSYITLDIHLATGTIEPIRLPDGGGDDGFPLASLAVAYAGSASSVSSAPSLVAPIPQLADYLINGFWQYNSTIAHHWGSSTITYNINGLNANEQMLARSALNAWHEVANLTFVQTTGAANITFTHNGTMTAYETDNYTGSGIITSATVNISADWITNDGGAYDGKTGIDSYGYQTYVHEVGHALGLGHQGPYNGSASYSTDALFANDTWQYSIMSYFAQNNYGGSYRYVITPQMADIYATQAIYGAAITRTGDTVYGFHNTAGSIFNFSNYSQAPALTIYDSGGNDTLDCSGYSVAQTIDLHAGAFSSVGGLTNNIGIALNASIENAIGGSGNDRLIANDLSCSLNGGAGNDTLIGGTGNNRLIGSTGVDTLTGGGGIDTFVFVNGDSSAASGQHDRITDFISGVDVIDLTGIDAISSTGAYDAFRFIGTTAFDGVAGALDYFYNSSLGVTVLQGDTNGDRIADFAIDLSGNISLGNSDLIGIGLVPLVIESFGSTILTQIGISYFLNSSSGGSGPRLTYGGSAVFAGQFGACALIGAEATATGYVVAWQVAGADQYAIWNTDSNGNYLSNATGGISGSSIALQSQETSFHQDLNHDGVIGINIPTTVIESFGSTSLVQMGSNYFLNSNSSGSGPGLTYGGSAVVAGQFGACVLIGAEATATGYIVAWQVTGADQYAVWNTDSNGNYLSNATGGVSGNSAALQSQETSFHQDLNHDGMIGISLSNTTIESFGSTSLTQVGNHFYLNNNSTGFGPELTYGGSSVFTGQFGACVLIGAEATATGYIVAWQVTGADQYAVWNTDSNGNYLSNATGGVSGNSAALQSQETSFHQDLNHDGVIGINIPTTVIESFGSTSLVQLGSNYFLNDNSSGSGPGLTYGGSAVFAGQFGACVLIGAEATATGYVVAWQVAGADQYAVWNTDTNGNYLSNATGGVSGSSIALQSQETSFHQDLNHDGVIGIPSSEGPITLATADAFVFRPDLGVSKDVAANSEGAATFELDGVVISADKALLTAIQDDAQHAQSSNVGHDEPLSLGDHDSVAIIDVAISELHSSHFIH